MRHWPADFIPPANTPWLCDCCEKWVARIHRMDWENDLNWLCDECCEQAIEESE